MKYKTLISVKNLELAWRRINTGRNLQYKRFFRPTYLAYEAGLPDNLRLLNQELMAGWQPSPPTRTYIPKPSGLQRPITLLNIEDQIVLQAISNIYAEKLRKRRAKLEHETVFSNVLSKPGNSIFFVDQWQVSYQEFRKASVKHFLDGYRWIAHFDLAAYFDTISHCQLTSLISPRGGHGQTRKKIQEWLSVWTTYDCSPAKNHAIPQGPVASNFLAEAFFLPIDEQMSKLNVQYTRYVDDIRIFGKTQQDVQQAAIKLELLCQNHGLIPQGKKFAIKEAENVEEALAQLASVPTEDDGIDEGLTKVTAESLFKKALHGRPLRVKDKSLMRYVLYRTQKSDKILRWVLTLIPSHPEHIDAFCHFLANYNRNKRIVRTIEGILDRGMPYPYARGELWHIVAKIADTDYLRIRRPVGLKEYRNSNYDVTHRWGLLHFLFRCEKEGIGRASSRLLTEHELIQTLLAHNISERQFEVNKIIPKILKQKKLESSIVIGRTMREHRKKLRDFKMRSSDLRDKVQNVFKGLGIIERRKLADRDYVGELLSRLYNCSISTCWKYLLESEYEYGLQILLEAEAAYEIDRSGWMRNQNSFNDMLVRGCIRVLKSKGLAGSDIRLSDTDGKLIKFGSIVQPKAKFDQLYPMIASGFRDFNKRRNNLPDSHPFDEKSGAKNTFLKKKEQETFVKTLKKVLNEVIKEFTFSN